MTHPSAPDANGMARLSILSRHGPAKSPTLVFAFAAPGTRKCPPQKKAENLSRKERKDESNQDKECRKVRIHALKAALSLDPL
jgi:hypothetical protein